MHTKRLLLALAMVFLAATRAPAMDVEIKVSSFKFDFGLPHTPENLMDDDLSTAWVGGGIGPGVGQWIDLHFKKPARVARIGIFNGHQGEGQFQAHRRIRSGRILYPDGTQTRFWLRDELGEQIVECRGVPFESLRIIVDDVFPKGEVTAKKKLAVSEIKLYLSTAANPKGNIASEASNSTYIPAPPPLYPDLIVPDPIVELLKEYYVRLTNLDNDYAELFAEDVRDRNDFRFEVFKEVQRQRGTYKILRTAKVDPSGLGFELVEMEGDYARVRVFGAYRVQVADLDKDLEEDSTFVLGKGPHGWKIIELEGEEELF